VGYHLLGPATVQFLIRNQMVVAKAALGDAENTQQ
jgi:hypothetical protein